MVVLSTGGPSYSGILNFKDLEISYSIDSESSGYNVT